MENAGVCYDTRMCHLTLSGNVYLLGEFVCAIILWGVVLRLVPIASLYTIILLSDVDILGCNTLLLLIYTYLKTYLAYSYWVRTVLLYIVILI